MKFTGKDWLHKYLDFRIEHFDEAEIARGDHPDFSLYSLIQPTGLLYGNPVQSNSIDRVSFSNIPEQQRVKLILAESLVNSYLLSHRDEVTDKEGFKNELENIAGTIVEFYNNLYPELSVSKTTLFGKTKCSIELSTKIIDKRVGVQKQTNNFWIKFFSNSLLFLDIYFFGQWQHTQSTEIMNEFFKEEKEELRLSVLKVIITAAHANNIIEIEERKLFEFLLQSAQLGPDRKRQAKELFENGMMVEEIELPKNNSWLLKKYFLELAILTVSSDRVIDSLEREFLTSFGRHLGFFDDDLDNSILAIEGFIIDNWDDLDLLKERTDISQLSVDYESKLLSKLRKNEKKLIQEVRESESIMRLYRKKVTNEIDPEQEDYLRSQLLGLLQGLSVFSNLSLPLEFLSLDTLINLLPFDKLDD